MPSKKHTLNIEKQVAGQRLDQVLAAWLPKALGRPISKAKVRKLIVAGAVYLNGSRVRIASKELRPNARVDVYVDLEKLELSTATDTSGKLFQLEPKSILFEDEDLIIVDKPAGLPTQPTLDEARDNLFAAIKKYLISRDGPAGTYVGLHHRLDRDTSGVVLFTKKERANGPVAELFSKRLAVKTYFAITIRPKVLNIESEWSEKNFLGQASREGKRAKFASVRSGGSFAHTDFKLIETGNSALLIEAQPKTGRTHQIRVHLAERSIPILGDALYGGPMGQIDGVMIPRMMLHAACLKFPHPITKVEMLVKSDFPDDFAKCLKQSGLCEP